MFERFDQSKLLTHQGGVSCFYCIPHWLGKQIEELLYLLHLPFVQPVHSDRAIHHKLKTNQIIGLSTHRPGYRTFLLPTVHLSST